MRKRKNDLAINGIKNQGQPGNDRRNFIRTAGLTLAGAMILPTLSRSASLFPSSSSFVPGESSNNIIKDIGIQLYTVRKEMSDDPIATLKRLAKIGFKELESARSEKGNYYGLEPKEIKKIAADLGMRVRSGHIIVDENWKRSIEQATETGQEYLISAVLPSKGQTIEHYQASADEFNKLGEECKKANLSFGYHNHETEFEVVNGQVLYDILLDRCDPSLVTMELDLGWVVAAGHDPMAYFSKYPGRFPLWHLKDVDPVKKMSVEFGKGTLDITGLLKQAKKSGLRYCFVEQEDYAVGPFEAMEFDYSFLKKL